MGVAGIALRAGPATPSTATSAAVTSSGLTDDDANAPAPRKAIEHQARFIATYFVDRYSSMPSRPPSRPKPDCLTPPKGALALETRPWLRPTIPVWRPSMTRN